LLEVFGMSEVFGGWNDGHAPSIDMTVLNKGQKGFSAAILRNVNRLGWNMAKICCCMEYSCGINFFAIGAWATPGQTIRTSFSAIPKMYHNSCTLRAKLSGAVYCNRSCLCVCLFVCGSVTTINRNCVHRSSPNWVCKFIFFWTSTIRGNWKAGGTWLGVWGTEVPSGVQWQNRWWGLGGKWKKYWNKTVGMLLQICKKKTHCT